MGGTCGPVIGTRFYPTPYTLITPSTLRREASKAQRVEVVALDLAGVGEQQFEVIGGVDVAAAEPVHAAAGNGDDQSRDPFRRLPRQRLPVRIGGTAGL